MANLSQTTTTSMDTEVPNYSVSTGRLDETGADKETAHLNLEWPKYLGYYKTIPELRQAINALAVWTAGKGYKTDTRTQVILDNIIGWGEDSFQSIMENLIITKKINGDSYAEIIRNDKGTLINLKPLNPYRMRTIVNKKGLIIRYEEYDVGLKKTIRKYEPYAILHLVNDRVANEIHGTSVIESCQWVIDARNEAMEDWRRILHRSTIRILEVDATDTAKYTKLKTEYAEAIDKGEVMILPFQEKGGFQDLQAPPSQNFLDTIRYYENFFYQAVGVPKIILGGSQEFTEASAKVGYLTFEQVYMREQRELEADLWNQLAIKIEFERPVSLKEPLNESEAANTGQTGFQNNEVEGGIERNE